MKAEASRVNQAAFARANRCREAPKWWFTPAFTVLMQLTKSQFVKLLEPPRVEDRRNCTTCCRSPCRRLQVRRPVHGEGILEALTKSQRCSHC